MTDRPLPLRILDCDIGVIVNLRGFQSSTLTPAEAREAARQLVDAAALAERPPPTMATGDAA